MWRLRRGGFFPAEVSAGLQGRGRAGANLVFESLDCGFEVPQERVVGAEGEFSAIENHLPRDRREVGIHAEMG